MATIDLSDIETRARQITDRVGSDFFSAAEMEQYIDNSVGDFYDLLQSCYGANFTAKSATISTTAGTDTYTLATDFYKLLAVKIPYSTSPARYVDALPGGFEDFDTSYADVQWYAGRNSTTVRYQILSGNTIRLMPAPPTSGIQIVIKYYPAWDVDALTVSAPNGWEQYIVWGVAAQMMIKENSDYTRFEAMQQKMALKIRNNAERVSAKPLRVRDVAPDGLGYRRRYQP